MKSDTSTSGNARHVRRLKKAGYRIVPQFVLALAKTGFADPFARRQAILPRRSLTTLAPLITLKLGPAGQGRVVYNLRVATGRPFTERAAATLHLTYRTFWGRKIRWDEGEARHAFFADPIDDVIGQSAYFDVPPGAFWVVSTIQRHTDTRRIGLSGSLKPAAFATPPEATWEQALASRDRLLLESALSEAKAACNRTAACQILARLSFLLQRRADRALLRHISDIDAVFKTAPHAPAGQSDTAGFEYDALLTTRFKNTMLLSRWLKSEAITLQQATDVDTIVLTAGPDLGLRLMAACYAGKAVQFEGGAQYAADGLGWITIADFEAVHALT